MISVNQVNAEYKRLGLLDSGIKIDFAHTHTTFDEKANNPSPIETKYGTIYYGSLTDRDVIKSGALGLAPLNSFTTWVPTGDRSTGLTPKNITWKRDPVIYIG